MSTDCHRICSEVEDATHTGDNRRQTPEISKAYGCLETVVLRGLDDEKTAGVADCNRACIVGVRYGLNSWDRTYRKERDHRLPVVGRFVAKLDRDSACCACALLNHPGPPERLGRSSVQLLKGFVEASDAAKARCQSDLDHGQSRILYQLLGQKDPPGLSNRDRRCAKISSEQAAELTLTNPQPCRQCVHIVGTECARLDQAERPRYRVGFAPPER